MISITKAFARSFVLDYMDLHWETGNTASSLSDSSENEYFDYDFYVLRSESPMGPFDQIGGPLRDVYHFRDGSARLLHKWRRLYYKLKVVNRKTGESEEFGPFSNEAPPDLIAAEIVRQEDVLFREFLGRRCWFYKARTFGPRCSCYDTATGRRTRGNHLPCYGTGFLSGYLAPIEVFVKIEPTTVQTSVGGLSEKVENLTRATMISFPLASPRDILIEAENKRWRIEKLDATERLRATLHQEILIKEIDKGEVEYAIPLPVDPSTVEPAARRNFTNPHNIEEDGRYDDIRSFFGDPRRAR